MLESTVVSVEQANEQLGEGGALMVDLRKPEDFAAGHVPGAVNVAYEDLVRGEPPVGGLLPHPLTLAAVLGTMGLTSTRQTQRAWSVQQRALGCGSTSGCGPRARTAWPATA